MECKLRPWKIEDKSDLVKSINNKKVLNNLRDGIPYPYTESDAVEFINSMLSADKDNVFAFAITVNDRVVGSISAFRNENIHFRTAELGYYISEQYWSKNIGTSAVKQICDYIFENTNIIRIYAMPFSDNIASCRVLEKAGFFLEGILRKNAVKDGIVRDMKVYSSIKD